MDVHLPNWLNSQHVTKFG